MEPIKTGIIGLGRLGRKHASDVIYKIPGAELVAACSVVNEELEMAASWGVQHLYTDHREMLENIKLDAVIIVSPSTLHKNHVMDAIDAGVHIFCEKPLALELDDCIVIEEATTRMKDKKFMLGFMRRFDPSYLRVKKMVESGKAGSPIVFKGNSLDPMDGIEEYLAFAKTSGGPFLDMAIHDIDLAHWYLGSSVKSVFACGNSFVTPQVQGFGDNDNAFAMLFFENDAVAMLHAGRTAPNGYQVDGELVCTKATYRVNDIPRLDRVTEYTSNGVLTTCEQRFFERFDEAFVREKECFFDCIRNDTQPPIMAKDGTFATHVALCATESMNTGKVVTI